MHTSNHMCAVHPFLAQALHSATSSGSMLKLSLMLNKDCTDDVRTSLYGMPHLYLMTVTFCNRGQRRL